MKKFITVLALTMASSSFAASNVQLQLKGTIQAILDITIQPEGIAQNLNLTQTQNNLKVATLTEKSNASNGYKVLISSQNQGKLKNGNKEFAYTLNYNGAAHTLNSQKEVSYSTQGQTNRDVGISYTGIEQVNLAAGDYTDTITFQISSN